MQQAKVVATETFNDIYIIQWRWIISGWERSALFEA